MRASATIAPGTAGGRATAVARALTARGDTGDWFLAAAANLRGLLDRAGPRLPRPIARRPCRLRKTQSPSSAPIIGPRHCAVDPHRLWRHRLNFKASDALIYKSRGPAVVADLRTATTMPLDIRRTASCTKSGDLGYPISRAHRTAHGGRTLCNGHDADGERVAVATFNGDSHAVLVPARWSASPRSRSQLAPVVEGDRSAGGRRARAGRRRADLDFCTYCRWRQRSHAGSSSGRRAQAGAAAPPARCTAIGSAWASALAMFDAEQRIVICQPTVTPSSTAWSPEPATARHDAARGDRSPRIGQGIYTGQRVEDVYKDVRERLEDQRGMSHFDQQTSPMDRIVWRHGPAEGRRRLGGDVIETVSDARDAQRAAARQNVFTERERSRGARSTPKTSARCRSSETGRRACAYVRCDSSAWSFANKRYAQIFTD